MGLLRSALLRRRGGWLLCFQALPPRTCSACPWQRLLMREHGEPPQPGLRWKGSSIRRLASPCTVALRAGSSPPACVRAQEGVELNAKVERQKQDLRPGSLDTWERKMSSTDWSTNRRLADVNL